MIRTFTGKNSFLLHEALKKLVTKTTEEVGELGVERLDASETEVDVLLQAVQSLPFLVPKKLLIITNAQSNLALMDRLEELVERTAENVEVVLVDSNFDKRKSSFKILQKLTSVQDFSELKSQELPAWIIEQAKSHSATISRANASFLVERVGTNQLLLSKEIEKLALHSSEINRQSIELLTDQSVQSTIFSLLDAAFSGNSVKAVRVYREQRRARVEPQYIIAMLTWQLHALALAVFAEPKNEKVLIEAGQSLFTAQKSLALAKKINKSQLRKMVKELSELDAQIKTNTSADDALELYLLDM